MNKGLIERRENTFVSHPQRMHLQLAFASTKDQSNKAMETIAWLSNHQQCLVVYAASIIQQNKPSNKYLYVCMIIHSQSTTKLMSTKPWGLSHKSLIFPLFWPETSKPFEIWMCKPVNKSWSYTLVCFRTHSELSMILTAAQVRCIHYTKVKAGSIRNSKCFITFGAWWCQKRTIPIMMNSKMWTRTSIHLRKQRSIIKIKYSSYYSWKMDQNKKETIYG